MVKGITHMRLHNVLIIVVLFILNACDSGWVNAEGDIRGNVIDEKSGQSIPDARIKFIFYTTEKYDTISDENGEYVIEMAELGAEYDLHVEKKGYIPIVNTIDVPYSNDPFVYDIYMTPVESPIVSTLMVSNITSKGATFWGRLDNDGGVPVVEKGFYVGRSRKNCFRVIVPASSKSFTCVINNMDSNTEYGYAAFANNGVLEGEGEWLTFETI